jgi:hypothetical protein
MSELACHGVKALRGTLRQTVRSLTANWVAFKAERGGRKSLLPRKVRKNLDFVNYSEVFHGFPHFLKIVES